MKRWISLLALAAACAPQATQVQPCTGPSCNAPLELIESERLAERAAAELRCPPQQVRLVDLTPVAESAPAPRTGLRGVEGCGARLAFVSVCVAGDPDPAHCRWSRLSDWLGPQPAPADKPQPAGRFMIP